MTGFLPGTGEPEGSARGSTSGSMAPTAPRVTGGRKRRTEPLATGAPRAVRSPFPPICYTGPVNTRRVVPSIVAATLLLAGCGTRTGSVRPIAAPSPLAGTVVYVSGGVRASSDGAAWIDVEPGDAVGAGATIRTGADGYCELRFGGAVSVRVEPDTEFRCGSVSVGDASVVSGELSAGAILAKVQRLGGSDLRIRTSSVALGVRGTAFRVSVSGGVTTVTVREGTVSVTRAGTTVDVEAGQRAEAAPDTAVITSPAAAEDLAAIEAFVPSTVDLADVGKLVKVIVVVEPSDASIILDGKVVGRGTWGIVLGEGTNLTLLLRRDGYEDGIVFVPEKGRRAARIVRKLAPIAEPKPAVEPSGTESTSEAEPSAPAHAPVSSTAQPSAGPTSTPVPSTAQVPAPAPAGPAPEPTPSTAPAIVAPSVEQPLASRTEAKEPPPREAAPLSGLSFRVDPAIGNDPFFRWAAERFAQRLPGFSLVTGAGSADLEAPAWPRGADAAGGIDNTTSLTYERLPQLVAAKLVRPLDNWFDPTQLARALVEAVRVGGRVYGAPIGGMSPILYYNKRYVREPPRTWGEIADLGARQANQVGDALAMASLEPFIMGMFAESRDIRLLAPDGLTTGLGTRQAAGVYDAMREAFQSLSMPVGVSQEDAMAWFRDGHAALLIDGPWWYDTLWRALGDSLGVATLPSWGSPGVELTPYANVLALFVSSGVNDERAAVLRSFVRFLLEPDSQLTLCEMRRETGSPIAPALRFRAGDLPQALEQDPIVPVLYRQLETAVPMPRGPLAADAWRVFAEVLEGIRLQEGGEMLSQMADARFLLYGLERKPVPAGARELRAVIDPPEKSQGLFFRPFDGESDLRLVAVGKSRGVVSENRRGLLSDRGELSFVYLVVNHDPYRAGRAPALRGRIEYFDEPNATLRVVYDSKDRTVRENPDAPDTWGAWKEAIVITCTGTREWKTADFPVPDARFDRRCDGADLRIEVSARGRIPAIRAVILTPLK